MRYYFIREHFSFGCSWESVLIYSSYKSASCFFNQILVWCSHSRIKFPAIAFSDTYKTWRSSQTVQTWKRHQEAQWSTHNYKPRNNRISLICPISSWKCSMMEISLFFLKQCVPELLIFCFQKFSVNLYCFNCLPCLLLFLFFCLYHKTTFFKFLVNFKIIPEIFLLKCKQTELTQHFLTAHAITISTFCELSSVAPNAVSYHAQKLDSGCLISSSSKEEWLHISHRQHCFYV